jgi:NAD(P)-dependent dehydrogenase (short-subunit alcohol dehydrogenase family)
MPLLFRSSDPRLLFITSGTSSLDEAARGLPYTATKPPAGWPKPTPKWGFTSYRSSKAAMNMMMLEWKRELQNDPIKIFGISPGFLVTGLGGGDADTLKKMGAKDPSEGGNFVRDVVEGKKDEYHGQVIRVDNVQPW